MRKSILSLLLFLTFWLPLSSQKVSFDVFIDRYQASYPSLNLSPLQLSYQSNLESIPTEKRLQKQITTLEELVALGDQLDVTQMGKGDLLDYRILMFDLTLQLRRARISLEFQQEKPSISDAGLYHQFMGKEWYEIYVQQWGSVQVSPDSLYTFGLDQIKKVRGEMKKIQEASQMDSLAFYQYLNSKAFLIEDPELLAELFNERNERIQKNIKQAYPIEWNLPKLRIAQGTNSALAQTPGYYRNQTFYYNLFDYPFNRRNLDWLFLHEGNPGHHFQVSYANQLELADYRSGLWFAGYVEGWAAYIEEYGQEVGFYQTPYDYFGKWEWDIVRSARIAMDVGINYYGWTDAEALTFWEKYVPNQDEIAQREINRMRRWPGQVHSYKVGAVEMQRLRKQQELELGQNFDPVAFHKVLLDAGPIPVHLLTYLFD